MGKGKNSNGVLIDTLPTSAFSPTNHTLKRTHSKVSSIMVKDDIQLPQGYDFKINQPPLDRPVRIYCDGIYDMFHFGHAKALEQAKKSFPNVYLLVGVCNDKETHERKGRTVMTDIERYESIRHCKWVDQVVESAPWIVTQEFLDTYEIDYVAHDAEPYQSSESGDVYNFVKSQGRFLPTRRTDGISTSDLITRIVRDYDKFLRRNLERGVSAKELNISFLKEQQIKTKRNIEKVKTTVIDHLEMWESQSHNFITDFASLFGVESIVGNFLAKRRLITSGTNIPIGSSTPTRRNLTEKEQSLLPTILA